MTDIHGAGLVIFVSFVILTGAGSGFPRGKSPEAQRNRGALGAIYVAIAPGRPSSTANVFNVDTLASGVVTSETTRKRIIIALE